MVDWNPLYGVWHGGVQDPGPVVPKSYVGPPFDDYKKLIGVDDHAPKYQAASNWGPPASPIAAPFKMSVDDFKSLCGKDSKKAIEDNSADGTIEGYLKNIAEAFRLLQIDTIHAQALFLAHAAGETGLAAFTEGQKNFFENNPRAVEINPGDPKNNGPSKYAAVDAIDPAHVIVPGGPYAVAPGNAAAARGPMSPRDWDRTFIGRGPIQVTFRYGYVQALAYLDVARDAATGDDAARLGATFDAIKADPVDAADPKNTFIFSMAYMHMSGMVRRSSSGFSTAGMAGGNPDPREGIKKNAYGTALGLLGDQSSAYKTATEN